jgi:hypothetical protein
MRQRTASSMNLEISPLRMPRLPKKARSARSVSFETVTSYDALVNAINWQPKALRQLRKIDARIGKQIRQAVSTELVDLARPGTSPL